MLMCAWPAQHKGVLYSVGNVIYWKFSGLKNFWCTLWNQQFSHWRYIGRWTISTEISSKHRANIECGRFVTRPWTQNVMNTGIEGDELLIMVRKTEITSCNCCISLEFSGGEYNTSTTLSTTLDCRVWNTVGDLEYMHSQSLSLIVTSATVKLMVTCCSISPGRVLRLAKKFSKFSGNLSLVISTKKHCCRCVFENGPTSWLVIAIKSLLPGGI